MSASFDGPRRHDRYNRLSLREDREQFGGFLLDPSSGCENNIGGKGKQRAVDQESAASGSNASTSISNKSENRHGRMSSVPSNISIGIGKYQDDERNKSHAQEIAPAAIDATQIVRMALSLNESRRMHLDPGQLSSPTGSGGRRVTSSSSPLAHVTQFPERNGGSLRYHLQQQRRSSRNVSPTPSDHVQEMFGHQFSPATLVRAEKARTYIELSTEYRRLLDWLPKFRPQELSKNSVPTPQSRPLGQPESKRRRELGRAYNPLQYLRNRKVRARERYKLDGEASGWNDVSRVAAWVDSVETKADHPEYCLGDVVMLPEWVTPMHEDGETTASPQSGNTGSRHGSLFGKGTRPKVDWIFQPEDLLADAYWLEQSNHKALIESRRGDKLFPRLALPDKKLQEPETPRMSYETQFSTESEDVNSPESYVRTSYNGPDRDVASLQHRHGKVSRATRHLLRRPKVNSPTFSNLSGSENENTRLSLTVPKRRVTTENIGPLERHMKSIMEAESRNQSKDALDSPVDPWDRGRGSMRGKEENAAEALLTDEQFHNLNGSAGESLDNSYTTTPRISLEQPDDEEVGTRYLSIGRQTNQTHISATRRSSSPTEKPKASRLGFLKRGATKDRNKIHENDFGEVAEGQNRMKPATQSIPVSPRQNNDYANDSSLSVSLYAHSRTKSTNKSRESLESKSRPAPSDSNTPRFFKGGRIGDIVRGEKPRLGDFVWKRHAPRRESQSSSEQPLVLHSSDEGDDADIPKPHQETPWANDEPPLIGFRRRSRSASDLKLPKYHYTNLPSFKRSAVADVDKMSRFGSSLATEPPDLSDVSPNTSSLDVTATLSGSRNADNLEKQESYGFPPMSRSTSRSTDKPLNAILGVPSIVGKRGLPPTALGSLEIRRNAMSQQEAGGRSWSIADGNIAMIIKHPTSVNSKEIEYVSAMLVSSGVKASSLYNRAWTVPERTAEFLIKAAQSSRTEFEPVSRKQEPALAARILSNDLENSMTAFEKAAEHFRGETCRQLHDKIENLRHRIDSDLTPQVRSCGDDADAFMGRLTTTHTLSIKLVNDKIDHMMRSRRRRLRLLSRIGFAFLEWLLVGLMWGIWLLVTFIRGVNHIIVGIIRFIRWLLCM